MLLECVIDAVESHFVGLCSSLRGNQQIIITRSTVPLLLFDRLFVAAYLYRIFIDIDNLLRPVTRV